MIYLYDTTLRDGTQGEAINFSVDDKLRIAQRLDDFGMHYIEGFNPDIVLDRAQTIMKGDACCTFRYARVTPNA